MTPLHQRARAVADQLEGTRKSEQDAIDAGIITQAEYDSAEFRVALEQYALRCNCCGWWQPADEMDPGDPICAECAGGGG